MNENRPDSSVFSADSKRKLGPCRRSLAKTEIGVSTSATKVATNGIKLLSRASERNSSGDGVTECWSRGVMGRILHHSATLPLHYSIKLGLRIQPSKPLFYPLQPP